jgi:hypothetical protein
MKNFVVASSYNNHINAVTSNEEVPVKYFWNKNNKKKVWSEKPGRSEQHWVVSLVPEKKHFKKDIICEYLEHRVHGIKRRNQISQGLHKKTFIYTNEQLADAFIRIDVKKCKELGSNNFTITKEELLKNLTYGVPQIKL